MVTEQQGNDKEEHRGTLGCQLTGEIGDGKTQKS